MLSGDLLSGYVLLIIKSQKIIGYVGVSDTSENTVRCLFVSTSS